MESKINILYVDDQLYNLNAFKAHFRIYPKYKIFICQSGREGLEILNKQTIQVIISDQRMPNMTGVEFLEEASKTKFEPIKIVVTAHRDTSAIVKAFNEGKIFRYHDKPWNFDALEQSIEEAYKAYSVRKMIDFI